MMRKWLVAGLTGVLILTAGPSWGDKKSKEYERGEAFCPAHVLVVGNVLVQPGRCYLLAVLRDGRGTFLALLNPSAKIHGRDRVRLNGEDGERIRSKIVYLVPMQATGFATVVIPINTIQLVQIHEEEDQNEEEGENNQEGQQGQNHVTLVIQGMPGPNLSVTFVVRF